jgi:hypothetical protein
MYRVFVQDKIMDVRFKQYQDICEGLVWQNDQAISSLFNEYVAIVKDVGLTSNIVVHTFTMLEKIHLARKGQQGYELEVRIFGHFEYFFHPLDNLFRDSICLKIRDSKSSSAAFSFCSAQKDSSMAIRLPRFLNPWKLSSIKTSSSSKQSRINF